MSFKTNNIIQKFFKPRLILVWENMSLWQIFKFLVGPFFLHLIGRFYLIIYFWLISQGHVFAVKMVKKCLCVCRAMFCSGLKESHEDRVEIKGLDSGTMRTLLEYTYTSRVFLTHSNVQGILEAASQFQVKRFHMTWRHFVLKVWCTMSAYFLKSSCSAAFYVFFILFWPQEAQNQNFMLL